ncbi:MAG: DMT family transporter [Candidatus Kapaibacteriales bacterium]
MKSWKAEILLLSITVIWGVTFSFTKIGLYYSTPILYLTLRFIIAVVFVYLLWFHRINKVTKKTFLMGTVLGCFYAGGFLFQTIGLQLTTVTKSAFITGLSVVLTPLVYKMIEARKITLWQKVGISIATLGLIKFTNPSFQYINTGDFLTFISTFFWAFYLVYMNKFTEGTSSFEYTIQLVFVQFVIVLLLGILGLFIFETKAWYLKFDQKLILSLLYNGIIASILLTTIHTSIQKYTTPVKAALIFSLEPVFAGIFAYMIFSETLNPSELIGAVILTIGIFASEFGDYWFFKKQG